MYIQWLPTVLRRFAHRSLRLTSATRRKPISVTRLNGRLESLEDRSLLAANLIGINLPPVGVVDNYSLLASTPLSAAVSVLANDTDPNTGDILHAQLVLGTLHGHVDLGTDGFFVYTPNTGYIGPDLFTYLPNDGTLAGLIPTVVNLTVGPNASPVAVDDAFVVAENSILNVSIGTALDGVLENDTDADTPELLLTAVLVTGPTHGSLTFLPTGTFLYTPNPDFTGTDTFTYRANDLNSLSNLATATITVVPVGPGGNHAPVAVNDTFHVTQDSVLNLTLGTQLDGVLANDTDADGNILFANLVTGPQHGILVFVPELGTFNYTPTPGYVGPDSFTYRATDLLSESNIATVSIIVDPSGGPLGNHAPVAVNDSFNATEDTLLNISLPGVLANDTDQDGNLLLAQMVTGPQHGLLVLLPNGSIQYTPAPNYSGPDSFTYQATDGLALSNVATVSITVSATNDPPSAANDSYTTTTSTTLNVSAANGVLANDSDAENQALTATIVTNASHGNVTLNPNGSFTYVPTTGYTGPDSFTYRANDGSLNSNVATVTITIAGVTNGAPTAQNDTYNINEDSPLTTTTNNGVLFNDTDPESNPLTATLVSNPAHGTVLFNPNGTFTYTPNSNYSGTDSFTYQASDGTNNSNVATVTFNIAATNDAPVAGADAYSVDEGGTLAVGGNGVLANDTDAENSPLTAILVTNVSHGNLSFNSNGSFTYTPTALFHGTDSFTYHANDGSLNSANVTVTITVNSVNSLPVAVNDNYAVNEDGTLTVSGNGVLGNDTDADGDPLTANVLTGPAHGSLNFNANGSFTYTPAANFSGSDSFTYRANDGTANGNVATVQITVTGFNDAPVGVNDNYTTMSGVALTVPAAGVLSNDTDADGNPLTATKLTDPANGTVTLNSNGSFTYTPAGGFTGTDSFTYQVNDGTTSTGPVTVTIQVTAAGNTAPVSANDAYSTTEDSVLTVAGGGGVLANDNDPDGNTLIAVLVDSPQHGSVTLNANGSFTYTPAGNYNGPDSFTYRANDGTTNGNLATVNLTITAVNDVAVSGNDAYTIGEDGTLIVPAASGVLANDTDAENNTLTATLVSPPQHGLLTLNADGSFTYIAASNYNGPDSFTYRANDGTGLGNTATVNLTITAVNDAPVATPDAYATTQGTTLTVPAAGVLTNDTDAEGNPLTATTVTLPLHGTLTLNSNGSFTYVPTGSYTGPDSFTYQANDGSANSAPVTVTIQVNAPANTAPVSLNDTYTINEDGVLTVVSGNGVLVNDTDPESNPLTAAIVSLPTHGSLTFNPDGSFIYTPGADFNGSDSFTYRANDGTLNGNTATVNITVNAVGEAPVIITSSGTTTSGRPRKVVLDPAVTVADADSTNFGGGNIRIASQVGDGSTPGSRDFIGFRHSARHDRVNSRRGDVRIGKLVIGTLTGGKHGAPVHIELNSNATIERVRVVLQNILFRGAHSQAGPRIVTFRIADDTHLESNIATKTVNVT